MVQAFFSEQYFPPPSRRGLPRAEIDASTTLQKRLIAVEPDSLRDKHTHPVHATFEQASIEKLNKRLPQIQQQALLLSAVMGGVSGAASVALLYPLQFLSDKKTQELSSFKSARRWYDFLFYSRSEAIQKHFVKQLATEAVWAAGLAVVLAYSFSENELRHGKSVQKRLENQSKQQVDYLPDFWWAPTGSLEKSPQQAYWSWRQNLTSWLSRSTSIFYWTTLIGAAAFALKAAALLASGQTYLLFSSKNLERIAEADVLHRLPRSLQPLVEKQWAPGLKTHPGKTFSVQNVLDYMISGSFDVLQALTKSKSPRQTQEVFSTFFFQKISSYFINRFHPLRLAETALFSLMLGGVFAQKNQHLFKKSEEATKPFHPAPVLKVVSEESVLNGSGL